MTTPLLPAHLRDDTPAWTQTVQAFLAEKERRSGSRRTVEGYARMLWPFFERVGSPDRVTPAHVLAWAHKVGGLPPALWADSSTAGRQAIVSAIFAQIDVFGFERLEYELSADAIGLGLDAALPPVMELKGKGAEFGRGERI
jgi:hypothetical protein